MNSTNSYNNTVTSSLIIEHFMNAMDLLFPVLYYVTAEYIEQGTFYHVKENELNPEYIVINPMDLDDLRLQISSRRLVEGSDYVGEWMREYIPKPTLLPHSTIRSSTSPSIFGGATS